MDQDNQSVLRNNVYLWRLGAISLLVGSLATLIPSDLGIPWFVMLLADLPTMASGVIMFAMARGFYKRMLRVFGISVCAFGWFFIGFAIAQSPYSNLHMFSDYLKYGGATIALVCMFYGANLQPNLEDWRKAGDRGVLQLIERLHDPHVERRLPAAKFLGQLGDPRAVEPLIQTLQDPTPAVRAAAAQALGMLCDPRAIPALQHVQQHDAGLSPDKRPLKVIAAEAIQRLHERA
jgi:hypothetical protein